LTFILLVLLAALAVRLVWVLTRPIDDASLDQLPDQREYLETARSLRAGDGLTFTDLRFGERVLAYRTPGYPFFIALFGANVRTVRIAQALLDTSTVLATYLLARRWLPRPACLFAALLVAFNPFLIYFTGLILTETLFTALLAWGLFLLTSPRTIQWLTGGILLALCILVRPGAIGLPILLGILAALATPHRRRWPLPVGTTMLLLMLIILAPWALRNHRIFGRWIWTSTNAGITSYDGFNPDATGASDQSFVQTMPQLRSMSETERNAYLSSAAKDFIREHPRQALQLAFTKIARTWSPRPLSDQFSRPIYVAAAMAYSIPFDLLIIAGLIYGPLPRAVKLVLTAPAIYLTVAAALSVGSLRYRIPAEVPISIVAASVLALVRPRRAPSDPTDVPVTPVSPASPSSPVSD
jgi:4-amino-4-deoxy-L-arabinose transferase-like glycosyltransferase